MKLGFRELHAMHGPRILARRLLTSMMSVSPERRSTPAARTRHDTSNSAPPIYLRDSKFIISSGARTGSTLLLSLLRSHPDIIVHGEALTSLATDDAPGMIWGTYRKMRGGDENVAYVEALKTEMRARPERFIQSILFDTQDRKIAGFKFKLEEAFDPNYDDYARILQEDRDIKVIHLSRKDLLDQFISHQVVLKQTGVTLIHDEKNRPAVRPFRADVTEAVSYCQAVVDRELRALRHYGDHRSISVTYEEIAEDDSARLGDILDFLGVPRVPLTTPTKKIIKDSRALLLNLDEVLPALDRAGLGERAPFRP